MRRRPSPVSGHDPHATALAWWSAFIATLALVALLGIARSAQALTLPTPGSGSPIAFDEEGEEDAEDEAGEDEEDEFGCSFDDEECEGEEVAAPPECLVQSADANVLVAPHRNRVRLLVRYAISTPTVVSLDYGLHGSKGPLHLGAATKHVGRKGVLHLDKSLTETQMAKAMAAKGFTVRLRAAATPDSCQAFFDYQLDLRRATPGGLSWQQSE